MSQTSMRYVSEKGLREQMQWSADNKMDIMIKFSPEDAEWMLGVLDSPKEDYLKQIAVATEGMASDLALIRSGGIQIWKM